MNIFYFLLNFYINDSIFYIKLNNFLKMDIYHNIYYDKKSKLFYYRKKTKHINISKSFKNDEETIEFTKILNENNNLTNERIDNIYNLKFNKYNTEFKYIYDNKK